VGTLLALVLVLALVIAVGTWIATYRALTEGSSGAIEHTTPRRGPCLIWSGRRATSRRRRFGSFTTARTGGKIREAEKHARRRTLHGAGKGLAGFFGREWHRAG
jgi:hypothetical protein